MTTLLDEKCARAGCYHFRSRPHQYCHYCTAPCREFTEEQKAEYQSLLDSVSTRAGEAKRIREAD